MDLFILLNAHLHFTMRLQIFDAVGIVATAGMLGAGSKQIGPRMGCRGAGYSCQFNFTAEILVFEIKGNPAHPAVLRPWRQCGGQWLRLH